MMFVTILFQSLDVRGDSGTTDSTYVVDVSMPITNGIPLNACRWHEETPRVCSPCIERRLSFRTPILLLLFSCYTSAHLVKMFVLSLFMWSSLTGRAQEGKPHDTRYCLCSVIIAKRYTPYLFQTRISLAQQLLTKKSFLITYYYNCTHFESLSIDSVLVQHHNINNGGEKKEICSLLIISAYDRFGLLGWSG